MSSELIDPRLAFTLDDFLTLSAALAIALDSIPVADRARFETATKLADIMIETQERADHIEAARAMLRAKLLEQRG